MNSDYITGWLFGMMAGVVVQPAIIRSALWFLRRRDRRRGDASSS